jgi:hypothetical protein
MSEATPSVVPSTTIFTLGRGSFVAASVTLPEIFPVLPANAAMDARFRARNNTNEDRTMFIRYL